MIEEVKLSIIVIGYNAEKYVEECLKSIILQANDKVEIIFVDDGSTDKTKEIVSNIFKDKKNCKYYYKENGGANSARIYGYLQAKGKNITFVDGDDRLEKNYISIILKELENEEFDFVAFNYCNVYNDNRKVENKNYKETIYKEYEFLDDIILSQIPHYLWNKVYKKEFLEKVEFEKIPKVTMGDDLVANIKMGLQKPEVNAIKEPIYLYYTNENSVSRKANPKFIEMLTVLKEIEKLIKEKELYEEYKEKIDFQYFRAFFFYVVKNKYKSSNIQKSIYRQYKEKKIDANKNLFIKEWNNKKSTLENILTKLYLKNYYLGYLVSRIYVSYDKIRRK